MGRSPRKILMEKSYAQALWKIVEGGTTPHEAVRKLHSSLQTRGREALMPAVTRAFKRLAAEKREAEGVTLTVARKEDEKVAHREAAALLKELEIAPHEVTVSLDETLIGGWRLEGRERLVDASFKKQLLSLYNRATQT